MTDEEALQAELKDARAQIKADRKLIGRAADALAEIDRGPGLINEHAEVLAALRIRLEGKARASLDDLLTAAGDLKGKKAPDLGDVLGGPPKKNTDWPEVKEEKKEWPGL
ncbi:MAG: hypothetical protein QOH90_1154 [Actinomycetota bacterium]|nr:hypothetical protein [Actinomycetota bacterium]